MGIHTPPGRRVGKRKRGARAISRVIVLYLKKRRRDPENMWTEAVRRWTWMASVSCLPIVARPELFGMPLAVQYRHIRRTYFRVGQASEDAVHVSTRSCRSPRRGALPRRPRPRTPPPSPRAAHGLPRPGSPSLAPPTSPSRPDVGRVATPPPRDSVRQGRSQTPPLRCAVRWSR